MAQRLALGFVGLLLAATLATAAQEFPRVVSAANVRLRIEPSEEVRIVTTLPLGTDVIELGTTPDRQWVRVRTADGREGWMLDDLSRRVAAGQRAQVAQAIIWERLQRTGDGFESWIALTHFIDQERTALPDLEWEARFALYRLQALAGTALAGERYNRPVAPAIRSPGSPSRMACRVNARESSSATSRAMTWCWLSTSGACRQARS